MYFTWAWLFLLDLGDALKRINDLFFWMVVVLLVLSGTTTNIQANEKLGTRKWGKARRWAWECRFPKPISTEPTLPRPMPRLTSALWHLPLWHFFLLSISVPKTWPQVLWRVIWPYFKAALLSDSFSVACTFAYASPGIKILIFF